MRKDIRKIIFDKYNGLCAYTGMPLGDDWQIDHIVSKYYWKRLNIAGSVDNIDNLVPALRIVNHYKRSLDLEGFRKYMLSFHIRLSKLPKRTVVFETIKRIDYLNKVALAFGITKDMPFSGKFYFETQNN